MRKLILVTILLLTGCAGFTVPFTDHKTMRWMFKADHDTLNADCIEKPQLAAIAGFLEQRHLDYLRKETEAVNVKEFKESLGTTCEPLLVGLTTTQIQTELFGTSAVIPNPEKLRELGGLLFIYQDILTDAGLLPTFHLEREYTGPDRRLVAIYQLTDGQIIHLQYSGKDNVSRRSLHWPVVEFFGLVIKQGADAVVP